MSFESFGPPAIDYYPCRYGTSRLIFRGPKRRLNSEYAVYMGGIETFGKFIPMPYPIELEVLTGLKSINLGCAKIGVDSYLNDASLIKIAQGAKVVVIEIVGAQNMSNRFYSVHPRRNDRFVRASARLKEAFPKVDFTDFAFTNHLLQTLRHADPHRFGDIVLELRQAWVSRMTELIGLIGRPIILVWLSDHTPNTVSLDSEPLFIDRRMIATLPNVYHIVEVVPDALERAEALDEMIFNDVEETAAREMMGPMAHRRVSAELARVINSFAK
jgi:uncharacterized protein YuzE